MSHKDFISAHKADQTKALQNRVNYMRRHQLIRSQNETSQCQSKSQVMSPTLRKLASLLQMPEVEEPSSAKTQNWQHLMLIA